jgi:hypothetical protein
MRCNQESDGAIHDPIAKPFAVISGAIAAIIMIPILPFTWLFRKGEN